MFTLNGKPLPLDTAFEHDGIQYPSNWLRLSSAEEKAALGITEVAQQPRPDDRFHYVTDNGDGTWTAIPKPLEPIAKQFMAQLDDHIAAIYERFQRFQNEYEKRESAALAYQADPTIAPDASIQAYADGVGVTYDAAVQTVINQANSLRSAIESLGVIRMKKYGIGNSATAEEAQALCQSLTAQADDIAKLL